jgi:protein-S-isoprenylcysteine O-methyltransferase Ste14
VRTGPVSSEAATEGPAALVDRFGRFVFRYRDYLVPGVLVGVLALTRPQLPFGSERLDAWLDTAGILVALTGQALRVIVIGYAYIRRGGINKRPAAPALVCEGVYAHSRNPMYLGDILLFVGLAMIDNSVGMYLVMLPTVAVALVAMVLAEERYLTARFGAPYTDYCARVNRFVPDLRGFSATRRDLRFDWRRVLRSEYGTTFAWVSAAFVLLARGEVARRGWEHCAPQLARLLTFYVPIVLAYGVVRWLKKTRRLSSPPASPPAPAWADDPQW